MTKRKSIHTKITVKNLALPLLFGTLLIIALVQGLLISDLSRQAKMDANAYTAQLLIDAAEGINSDLPIEAKTGTVFINNAGLTLPAVPSDLGKVTYSYLAGGEDFEPILRLARKDDINNAKSSLHNAAAARDDFFDKVPRLQACVRGVSIAYDKNDVQLAAGSKVLSNGKTIYFSTEPLCPSEDLLRYAKEVDSYK